MKKLFKNFNKIYENYDFSEIDPFGEEEWEVDKFKPGDYITVTKTPDKPHWLYNTKIRTFKLTGYPVEFKNGNMWRTDGGIKDSVGGFGIPSGYFRKATKEEIEERYGITEAIRWYKNGKLEKGSDIEQPVNTLLTIDVRIGQKVLCIKDNGWEKDYYPRKPLIKTGEIKTVAGFNHHDRRVYFIDTPTGAGNYDGDCFVLYDQ